MKKITMQDIADALQISRVTVWKVFSNREGVSDALKNKILTKAMELNYSIPEELREELECEQDNHQITVSVAVSRPESSIFWLNIIHEIAKELTKYNINLMYTYLPSEITKDYSLPISLTNGTTQGMIVLNVYNHELLHKLNTLKLPKVFMDVVTDLDTEELSGDLVLLDGLRSIGKITEHLILRGRRELGFIGDIQYAKTNAQRFEGFQRTLTTHGIKLNSDYCFTQPLGVDTDQEEIDGFLRSRHKMPQAFVCASDYIAHVVQQTLIDLGYSIPADIAISGYDGYTEYSDSKHITTVKVEANNLGKRLAMQLLYRYKNPNANYEIATIFPDVIFATSTNV